MNKTRIVIADLAFGVPMLFHTLCLYWPTLSIAESFDEHAAFIGVNAFMLLAMSMRTFPRSVLLCLLGSLFVQQAIVHGYRMIAAGHTDVQSVMAIIGSLFVLLYVSLEGDGVTETT